MVATMPSMHNARPSTHLANVEVGNKAIACTICAAQYAPTQAYAHLLRAQRVVVESAFMSMCHFCFRCRRPSCPLCWDDVHGLCGACVEDVHLPFRQQVAPLPLKSGLLLPPVQPHVQRCHVQSFPLVCIQPGRFHAPQVKEREHLEVPVVPGARPHREEVPPEGDEVGSLSGSQHQRATSWVRRVERVLTVVLALVLFVIAVVIFAASFSAQVNEAIVHLFHIDIRMEIEYLFQLIQQLRSGG